jgi:acetyl esterase
VRCLTYGFEKKEKLPLLIDIHGGGFIFGMTEMEDPFLPQFVEKCGVKVVTIDYSLSPEIMFPVAVEECYAVVKYCKNHAESLGIDGSRIIIMGHSAGGTYCAVIGLFEKERKLLNLKGIILDYPPTDFATDPYDKPQPKGALPPATCRICDAAYRDPKDAKNPLVSPSYATVDMVRHFPPTLVITAGNDSLATETERLKDTFKSAGVDVTFKRFEGIPHAFNITKSRKKDIMAASDESWGMMVDFVNKYI